MSTAVALTGDLSELWGEGGGQLSPRQSPHPELGLTEQEKLVD